MAVLSAMNLELSNEQDDTFRFCTKTKLANGTREININQ